MRALHLNTQFASLGGVEAVLRHHHAQDAAHGVDSRFIAFWEAEAPGFERARFLDFRRSMRVREARRRRAGAWPGFEPDVVAHHTVWGQPYLADLDGSARRVLFLHSDIPDLPRLLAARLPLMDGVVAVSDVLLERARAAAGGWAAERFHRVDYPIHPPAWLRPRGEREPGSPWVLGYAGRLDTVQKRVERFIELSSRLAKGPLRWRLEFLGDGPERGRLEAALPDRTQHVFHGRQSGDAYWRVVSGWDAILFTSDFEGTPIALIEAMAAGVLPVHPAIGCGGDAYAAQVDPSLVYAAGDMGAMAAALEGLDGWTRERVAGAVRAAVGIAARHDGGRYLSGVAGFFDRIRALPLLARPPARRWRFPMDLLSFGQFEWIARRRR